MAIKVRFDRAPYAGRQPAQSFGGRLLSVTGVIVGDDDYPTGGWEVDLSDFFPSNTNELVGVYFAPTSGCVFEYDKQNKKVKAYLQGSLAPHQHAAITAGTPSGNLVPTATENEYTVTYDGTPGGNEVYLKFDSSGAPYLCSNLANDSADAWIDFGGVYVKLTHDASAASGGLQVFVDDNGQLWANNSAFGDDVSVPTTDPLQFLVVAHDTDPGTNQTAAALFYDDGSDDRLEADLDGEADADVALVAIVFTGDEMAAHQHAAAGGASSGSLVEVSGGSSALDGVEIPFVAWGY